MIKHGHERREFDMIKIYAECDTDKGIACVGAYLEIKRMSKSEYRKYKRGVMETEIKLFMQEQNAKEQ